MIVKIIKQVHPSQMFGFCQKPLIPEQDAQTNAQMKGSIYELSNAQKYIETQVRKFDWVSYAISKHYPSQIRQDFLNICYFHSEISKVEEQISETSLGLGKLDFWSNAIESIYNNAPIKEPLTIALHQSCISQKLPKHLFLAALQSRKIQIEKSGQFADMKAMANTAEMNRIPITILFLRLLRQDTDNPEIRICIESVSRAIGILDYVRRVPYTLKKYKLNLPEDILSKHSVNVRNLWDRVNGKPKEELYDAILDVSAFARECLYSSQDTQIKLPPQAFRAFLHATEAEYYLELLEKFNFQIFEKALNTNSYVEVPYRIYKNAKNQRFLSKTI